MHAGDRHVVATAISAAADAIVTINVRHFPSGTLATLGITVHTPGGLIGLVLDTEPDLVVAAVEHLSARWANPPRTMREIVELLARHPTLAEPAGRLEPMLS